MLFSTLFILPFLTTFPLPLTLALALPSLPRTPSKTESFTVSNFHALDASSTGGTSSLSFHISDKRAAIAAEVDCTVPSTTASIYSPNGVFTPCNGGSGFKYKLTEGELVVRRSWDIVYEGDKFTVTGTAPQGTYWKEGINATTTVNGKQYTRTSDWAFPITSLSSSM